MLVLDKRVCGTERLVSGNLADGLVSCAAICVIKDMAFFERGVQHRLTRFSFEEGMMRDCFMRMQREGKFPVRSSS